MANPGGQRALTREKFDMLTPFNQGYAAYMQGAWNTNVPDECPYDEGSAQAKEWHDGNQRAYTAVLDTEE